MSLEYIFIIVLSLITVFVLVGLITSWSFNAKTMMCKLSGGCGTDGRTDSQNLKLAACTASDIIKYGKLCCQLVSENKIKQGDLCYALTFTSACTTPSYNNNSIGTALKPYCNASVVFSPASKLVYVISYNFIDRKLEIS